MEQTQPIAEPAPKLAPETLVLRGRPRSVVRFRRKLVVGGAASLSAAVIAIAWLALAPPSFHFALKSDHPVSLGKAPSDALAGTPERYSDIPKLGPPLPGDLGRGILERQRELAGDREQDDFAPQVSSGGSPSERAEAARQRRISMELAARSSPLTVRLATVPGEEPQSRQSAVSPPASSRRETGDLSNSKLDFTTSSSGAAKPGAVVPAAGRWVLSAGTIIPASLITAINSDLPGMVIAQVTENVRDSVTGRAILVPQGARLIGRYDSAVSFGQKRALLVWERIIFPDGSSITLDKASASDLGGEAGIEDRTDFHEWRLLKGIALSTILGIGSELSFGGGDIARAIRESGQQQGSRAADQIVQRNLNVQPTLRVRAGWPVRAIVNQDLALEPWRE